MSKELIVVEAEIEKLYIPKGGNVVKIVNKDNYRLLSDITKEQTETIAKLTEELEFRDFIGLKGIVWNGEDSYIYHSDYGRITITELRTEFLNSKKQ